MTSELVSQTEAQALVALDEAMTAITRAREASDVRALSDWRDQAAAAAHYLRRRDGGKRLADDAGEIKVRAERALGQIDAELNPHGGDRFSNQDVPNTTWSPDVSDRTRAAWRKLGGITEPDFTAIIVGLREAEDVGITTAAALAVADSRAQADEQARATVRNVIAYLTTANDAVANALAPLDDDLAEHVSNADNATIRAKLETAMRKLREVAAWLPKG